MRKLIVLAGLVSAEKVTLAVEIGAYFSERGMSVTLLDNISRLNISSELVYKETLVRHAGNVLPELDAVLERIHDEVVVLALSETAPPDDLFVALAGLTGWDVLSLAMIDLRTCDCFPNIRVLLEDDADIVVNLPYNKDTLLPTIAAELATSG